MPWSPKKEEQEVPNHESIHMVDLLHQHPNHKHFFSSTMDEMKFDGSDGDNKGLQEDVVDDDTHPSYWDFDFSETSDKIGTIQRGSAWSSSLGEDDTHKSENDSMSYDYDGLQSFNGDDDKENEDEEEYASLNLSLNYQDVLDAWSDRGTLWARDNSMLSFSNSNNTYMGEVPVMDEERRRRREESVIRYKEKRQTRLFSKKIRYQVRKLNADNRPRFKGRFIRKAPDRD